MKLPNLSVRAALVAVFAVALIQPGRAAIDYTPVLLNSPGFAMAFGLNNQGQIVGRATVASGETHAVLWDDGEMVDLGTLPGGTYSEAFAINDRGQVVGWSTIDQSTCTAFDGCWHAFLWENGTMTDLGGLDPRFQSYAYSINNSGQIVGTSATADYPFGYFRAVLWDSGVLTDLGRPAGASDAFALGINAQGIAVGSAVAAGRTVALQWAKGEVTELPGLPGSTHTEALKINNRGHIVGRGSDRALLWTKGSVTALPNLPGATSAVAQDINDRGLIVGESFVPSGGNIAVVWDGGDVQELPAMFQGLRESYARGVNNRGDVAGTVSTPNGLRAVVWVRR